MKLEKGLYAYLWQNPYENNCNSYVIQGELTLLIDPGHLRHVEGLFNQMKEDGISQEEIDIIILSHSHPDHFEGLEAFFERPIKIAMAEKEEQYLLKSGKHLYEMMRQPIPKYRVDFFLKEGDLRLNGEAFQIYQTPGHSPGSLSIYWPEKKALFTGDLLFYGGIGRTDFPEGNSKMLMESIERLSRLEIELLLPGHGAMVMGREKVLQNFAFIHQNYYPYL